MRHKSTSPYKITVRKVEFAKEWVDIEFIKGKIINFHVTVHRVISKIKVHVQQVHAGDKSALMESIRDRVIDLLALKDVKKDLGPLISSLLIGIGHGLDQRSFTFLTLTPRDHIA